MEAQLLKLFKLKEQFEKFRRATENALITTIEQVIGEFLDNNEYIKEFRYGAFYYLDDSGEETILVWDQWPENLKNIVNEWNEHFYQLEDDWWDLHITR